MDSNGKEITKIQYLIQSADLQNQIIINGQTATAVKGRTFLILTVKITNSSNQNIVLNARDYVRLTENDTPDLLAPDIHNDPVQVQAISTKVTRLGFPINSNDTKLTLHVGQISGKKTDIPLSLH